MMTRIISAKSLQPCAPERAVAGLFHPAPGNTSTLPAQCTPYGCRTVQCLCLRALRSDYRPWSLWNCLRICWPGSWHALPCGVLAHCLVCVVRFCTTTSRTWCTLQQHFHSPCSWPYALLPYHHQIRSCHPRSQEQRVLAADGSPLTLSHAWPGCSAFHSNSNSQSALAMVSLQLKAPC